MYEMSKAIEKAIINRHAFLFIFRSTRCFRGEACSDFTHRLATLPPFSHTAPRESEFTHQHFGDGPQPSQRGDRSDVVFKGCCYPGDWRNVHYSPQVWSSKKGGMRRLIFCSQVTHSSDPVLVGEFTLIHILRQSSEVRLRWLPGRQTELYPQKLFFRRSFITRLIIQVRSLSSSAPSFPALHDESLIDPELCSHSFKWKIHLSQSEVRAGCRKTDLEVRD